MILGISFVSAHMGHSEDPKQLTESGVPCSELEDDELEMMGDYYMGQIHPGEAHEIMDEMMGGEGSESLKQMHIAMAKRIYCKENFSMGYSMMGGGMMSMMGGNMMNYGGMMGSGYMTTGSAGWWIFSVFSLVFWIALLAIVVFLAILLYRKVFGRVKR